MAYDATTDKASPPKHGYDALMWDETFNVGLDTGTPVDDQDYEVPFKFTGKIDKLTVKLGPAELSAAEKEKTDKATGRRQ
jgi:hypothetical protein